MERSKSGLEAAGEWSELRNILPDFHNKKFWTLAVDMVGTANMLLTMEHLMS